MAALADSHVWEANANNGSTRCATLELKNISDKWLERMLEFDMFRQRVLYCKKDFVPSVFAFFQSILRDREMK